MNQKHKKPRYAPQPAGHAVRRAGIPTTVARAADPLASWNDGAAKKSIPAFVEKVTNPDSPDFVPVAERIATFDNDGSLWAEQPMYFQALFVFDRIKALAPQHPEWKEKEPFASVLKGDLKGALAGGERAPGNGDGHARGHDHRGVREDRAGLDRHRETSEDRALYTEMVYQPMLELLAYLRANGFKTFIVSGGGIEFMRPWTEKVYGIPPEQVVGSSIKTRFEMRDGQPVLVRLPELNFIDDKGASPSPSNSTSAAARSPPSATRMATCKCCNTPPLAGAPASASTSTTPTPCANGPTIANPTSADSTRASTKPPPKAGRSWI